MISEFGKDDIRSVNQGQTHDATLTPEVRNVLGDLALNSGTHVELSHALGEVRRMLTSLVKRHPEFRPASSELLARMDHFEHLEATLATEVMKYSHRYEDAAVPAP